MNQLGSFLRSPPSQRRSSANLIHISLYWEVAKSNGDRASLCPSCRTELLQYSYSTGIYMIMLKIAHICLFTRGRVKSNVAKLCQLVYSQSSAKSWKVSVAVLSSRIYSSTTCSLMPYLGSTRTILFQISSQQSPTMGSLTTYSWYLIVLPLLDLPLSIYWVAPLTSYIATRDQSGIWWHILHSRSSTPSRTKQFNNW